MFLLFMVPQLLCYRERVKTVRTLEVMVLEVMVSSGVLV